MQRSLQQRDSKAFGGWALTNPTLKMRKRKDIEKDGTRKDILTIEILLDIRDILIKATKKKRKS